LKGENSMETTLIAMITQERGSTEARKILSSTDGIFYLPNTLSSSTDYSPGALLEDGEWFVIKEFSTKSYCPSILKDKAFSSVDYPSIVSNDFGKIVFLCECQNDNFFFQRVTPARQVRKSMLFFGDQCRYEEKCAAIPINEFSDAIYNKQKDELYFRKLRDISGIFDGIVELYREATEDEVKNFLGYNFINLTEGFSSDNVKTNNRKRITLALEILNKFSTYERKKVFSYIREYCPELSKTNNKFDISNEESLKKLLYGIEQRYYTTPVSEEKRVANSFIELHNIGAP
jgi:hypothetical protein